MYFRNGRPYYSSDYLAHLVYVDQIGLKLRGVFHDNPTERLTPVFLFLSPLQIECINNMTCVRFPFAKCPFYWSEDPNGKSVITEESWAKFRIPKLDMKMWIGSYWEEREYKCVQNLLSLRGYRSNGKQYARDHEYPELMYGE